MKKFIRILIISLSFIFLISCTNKGTNNNSGNNGSQNNGGNGNTTTYSIKDYYPFEENVRYDYTGSGNEYATFKVWVDYINNDRIQLRKNNGGTETVTVLENKNGELKTVFSKSEVYYRENFTSRNENNGEILIKEPLVKGTSWNLSDGRKRYISAVDVTVGNYKAIEVTTENKDSTKNIDYYGLNSGLVKTVFKSQDAEVSSTLTKVQKNTVFEQTVRFYYPSGSDGKIYYTDKKLSFKTNDVTRTVFETYFKQSPNNNLGKLIGPDVKIKSLYLNNGVVYVDFSKELVPQMNAGSGYEASILQSITNTLGGYYNVPEVYITIEGGPYSSGHIIMKKGETFKVNTSNCVELK